MPYLKLYPNPSEELISIESEIEIENIQVYDVVGNLVDSLQFNKQIDVSEYARGTYLLKATFINGQVSLNKFIKY